jgi:hypothetical protein
VDKAKILANIIELKLQWSTLIFFDYIIQNSCLSEDVLQFFKYENLFPYFNLTWYWSQWKGQSLESKLIYHLSCHSFLFRCNLKNNSQVLLFTKLQWVSDKRFHSSVWLWVSQTFFCILFSAHPISFWRKLP